MKGKIFDSIKEKTKDQLIKRIRELLKNASDGDASELIATVIEYLAIGGVAVFGGKLILALLPKRVIHQIVIKM